jgi:hypothetical protein
MYTGLHVDYPLLLSAFNETRVFSTDLRKIPKYECSYKSVSWELSCSTRTFWRADRGTERRTWRRNFFGTLPARLKTGNLRQRTSRIDLPARLICSLEHCMKTGHRKVMLMLKVWQWTYVTYILTHFFGASFRYFFHVFSLTLLPNAFLLSQQQGTPLTGTLSCLW